MDWDKIRVFDVVARLGSFTKAGRELGLSQSAVSRQVGALEEDLGVMLFRRHPTGIELTEPGEELRGAAEQVNARLNMALARIDEYRQTPKGPLRVTTSVAFGSAWLGPRMTDFLSRYPDILVSLLLVDNLELDLSQGQADVAIRFTPQKQPNLVQRRLMSIRYHVFASSRYLERHGVPAEIGDLDDHRIVVYGEDVPGPVADMNWLLTVGREGGAPRDPALRINSVYGIYRAVRSGLGLAALPYYLSEEAPDLTRVLPQLVGPTIEAYLVYPEELRRSKRISALRDFLLSVVERRSPA
jgi:DNA-binding transcriptional LysR family regulator